MRLSASLTADTLTSLVDVEEAKVENGTVVEVAFPMTTGVARTSSESTTARPVDGVGVPAPPPPPPLPREPPEPREAPVSPVPAEVAMIAVIGESRRTGEYD